MTRAQRIANNMPSRLTITIFGNKPRSSSEGSTSPVAEPNESSILMPAENQEKVVDPIEARAGLPTVCEGWAPPPTPYMDHVSEPLSHEEKQDLVKLHKNLGHPDPRVFSAHLKVQKAPEHVVRAAADFICDACVETQRPRHQRPAKLHSPKEFNDVLGMDGFFWRVNKAFSAMSYMCMTRPQDFTLPSVLMDATWIMLYLRSKTCGPYGQVSQEPLSGSSGWIPCRSVVVFPAIPQYPCSHDSWSMAKRPHWKTWCHSKDMLHRLDAEQHFESTAQFDEMLTLSCQAKNQLSKQNGYSPEQVVLGKSTALPASIASDDAASAAHALALGSDLECERFRELLDRGPRLGKHLF